MENAEELVLNPKITKSHKHDKMINISHSHEHSDEDVFDDRDSFDFEMEEEDGYDVHTKEVEH